MSDEDRDVKKKSTEHLRSTLRHVDTQKTMAQAESYFKDSMIKQINSLQEENSDLKERLSSVMDLQDKTIEQKNDLMTQLEKYHERISLLKQENQQEKAKLKEQQERYTDTARNELEEKVTSYVTKAGEKLEKREKSLSRWSLGWGIAGAVFIICGVFTLLFYTQDISSVVGTDNQLSWPQLIYITLRGLVITSLLLVLSRYSFSFSKQFNDGAKEHEYRINAINFGRLYLEAKGADAEWEAMKDAFQNWGVSSDVTVTTKNSI